MSKTLTSHTYRVYLVFFLLPFLLVVFLAPFIGGESINIKSAFLTFYNGDPDVNADILIYQRIPRVLLAAFVGGTLAVVGACFQIVLHNPLAEPYTLGVTGGASVGAVTAIVIPGFLQSWGPFSTVQLFSLLGASASLSFLYAISRRPQGLAVHTLLLAGITISIISAGFILCLQYVASPHYLVLMSRWLMGGLEVDGYNQLSMLFPLLLPGLAMMFSCMLEMNHLSMGEELAAGHGVDVGSVQRRVFFGGGLSTAAVVSLSGPIGFVGLIVPHAVRRLVGFDQRIVLPGCFFLGGAFLVICDTFARTLLSPREMPVGIITALVGGPIFIRILLKKT